LTKKEGKSDDHCHNRGDKQGTGREEKLGEI